MVVMESRAMFEMIDVDVATSIVVSTIETLFQAPSKELIPLDQDSLGRYLAEDVIASEPFPPFQAAVLDGYAFDEKFQSDRSTFNVIEKVTAGLEIPLKIEGNQCAYVTTGSKLPDGTNTVVGVEKIIKHSLDQDEVTQIYIPQKLTKGANVRVIGKDISLGSQVLENTMKLGSAELGLLATLGHAEIQVTKKTVVGVFSTGDELVEFNENPQGCCIRDANRIGLLTLLNGFGAKAIDLGLCKDNKSQIQEKLIDGLHQCDIVVTSGGVSMGSADHMKDILREVGDIKFGRLNMKPGKPTTFATVNLQQPNGLDQHKLVFALPGNPVSCLVTARLLIQPALKKLSGVPFKQSLHPKISAKTASDLKMDPERPEYHRVRLEWCSILNRFIAYSQGPQQSSRLLSLVACNGLLCVPKGSGILSQGTELPCLLIGEIENPQKEVPPSLVSTLSSRMSLTDSLATTCCILSVSDGSVQVLKAGSVLSSQLHLQGKIMNIGFSVIEMRMLSIPSESEIQSLIKFWVNTFKPNMIFILGGCGLSKHDNVPEALDALLTNKSTVLGHLLNERASTASKISFTSTHRPVAGVFERTSFVVAVPGLAGCEVNHSAIQDSVTFLLPLVPRLCQVVCS